MATNNDVISALNNLSKPARTGRTDFQTAGTGLKTANEDAL